MPSSSSTGQPSLQKRAPAHLGVPALFRRPEAVLGVVLATAALLTDFVRNLFSVSLRSISRDGGLKISSSLASELRQLDKSIELLQLALDDSKSALSDSERTLDITLSRANTADAAINAISDSHTAFTEARQQANEVAERLIDARNALRQQAAQRSQATMQVTTLQEQRDRLQRTVYERERQVADLRNELETFKNEQDISSDADIDNGKREAELLLLIEQKDSELDELKKERNAIVNEASQAQVRSIVLEEEAAAANKALTETQSELNQLTKEALAREAELQKVEKTATQLTEQTKELDRLRSIVSDMEKEVGQLQAELQQRDQVVGDVSKKSDTLRALLATKEVEMTQLESKLQSLSSSSSLSGDAAASGNASVIPFDERESDLNLQEITDSLDAQRLELSADIRQAQYDLGEKQQQQQQQRSENNDTPIDELDRINSQMGVDETRLQANVIKAEAELRKKEYQQRRKDEALKQVLESAEDESTLREAALQWPPVYPDADQLGLVDDQVNQRVKDQNVQDISSPLTSASFTAADSDYNNSSQSASLPTAQGQQIKRSDLMGDSLGDDELSIERSLNARASLIPVEEPIDIEDEGETFDEFLLRKAEDDFGDEVFGGIVQNSDEETGSSASGSNTAQEENVDMSSMATELPITAVPDDFDNALSADTESKPLLNNVDADAGMSSSSATAQGSAKDTSKASSASKAATDSPPSASAKKQRKTRSSSSSSSTSKGTKSRGRKKTADSTKAATNIANVDVDKAADSSDGEDPSESQTSVGEGGVTLNKASNDEEIDPPKPKRTRRKKPKS